MPKKSIAIIGGGIGRLSSAIFLARLDYKITIYEKSKGPRPFGAGFLLQPPGQKVLAELGVLEEVEQLSVPIDGLVSKTAADRQLLDLNYCHIQGNRIHGLGVKRSSIYNALYNLALSRENIDFVWGADVVLSNANEQPSIQLGNSTQEYDLCVLASGSNSHLADALFPDRLKKPYQWKCLWANIKLPIDFSENKLHQRCHRASKMMGILPVCRSYDGVEAVLYWSLS